VTTLFNKLFETVTSVGQRFPRRRLLTVGAAAAVAIALTGSYVARGQVPPLQIIALAEGFGSDNVDNLHVKGPSDVLQTELLFQPGAETGWHMHPGPVVVVIKTGALTEIHSNGCITVHPMGSVFFETAGEVHNAINQTGAVVDVYATFLSPAGTQPLIPATDPGGVCRSGK
jgi:quercetin dioxygenase-like cupin family protein